MDDSAPPNGFFRALRDRLAGRPRRGGAEGPVDDPLGTTTPSLDRAAQRFEMLCGAIEADVRRLRSPIARERAQGTRPRGAALDFARAQIEAAEEQLDRMAKQSRDAEANADEWERRAILGVHAGMDDVAREALARRAEMASLHRALRSEVDVGRAALAEMRAALDRIAPASEGG